MTSIYRYAIGSIYMRQHTLEQRLPTAGGPCNALLDGSLTCDASRDCPWLVGPHANPTRCAERHCKHVGDMGGPILREDGEAFHVDHSRTIGGSTARGASSGTRIVRIKVKGVELGDAKAVVLTLYARTVWITCGACSAWKLTIGVTVRTRTYRGIPTVRADGNVDAGSGLHVLPLCAGLCQARPPFGA